MGFSPYIPPLVMNVVKSTVEVFFAVGSRQDTSTCICLVSLFIFVTVKLAWLWGRDDSSELENEPLAGSSLNDKARKLFISVWAIRNARLRCLLPLFKNTVFRVAWKITKTAAMTPRLMRTSRRVEPELVLIRCIIYLKSSVV